MIVVHRVDPAKAGQVAVLDVNAGDVVFALGLGLGAVLLQIVDSGGRHPQARGLPYDDPGAGRVEPQHIAVDGLTLEHEAGQAAGFVDGHLRDGGFEGRFHLPGKLDLHRAAQRLAVLAQQLFGLLGRADACILPGKAGDDLARAAVQRDDGRGLRIGFQVGGAQSQDVRSARVQAAAAVGPDKITRLGRGDLGGRTQLGLHRRGLIGQRCDLPGEIRHFSRDDPELVLGQDVVLCSLRSPIVGSLVQRIHQVVKGGRTLFPHGVQLGGGGVLGFLQQVDLAADLGELLAERRLIGVAVHLGHRRARRDALPIGHEVAQRSAARDIRLLKEQHALRVHRILHRGQKGRFVGVGWEQHMACLIEHIRRRQQQKHQHDAGQHRQYLGGAAGRFRRIAHSTHPLVKKSSVKFIARAAASGAEASSQTTPSMWRNQVSWRLA